ncbi:alpha-L-fucosidase-like [Glandiceps talaboti]
MMDSLPSMKSRFVLRDMILVCLAMSLAVNVALIRYIQSSPWIFSRSFIPHQQLDEAKLKQSVFNRRDANNSPTEPSRRYNATWESLDTRPLPSWYDEAKLGIFIHWGLFSVPAYGTEWFWWKWKGKQNPKHVDFMKQNYKPGFQYQDFADQFTATFFDPNSWAELFQASGARYVVLTSKHHEGWTNWPSKYSWNWNSVDAGPHRDLVGELATALRNTTGIKFGLYYSLLEWFNPLYIEDQNGDFKTQLYIWSKMMPELIDLVTTYRPELIWADGAWSSDSTYWNSTGFLAWLYSNSPVRDTVVVNDRWGNDAQCRHGDYYTCGNRFNPGSVQNHKWENCMTIDKKSWGYRKNANLQDFMDMDSLTRKLVETVSCGGNLLMNIGPTADGLIPPIYEERLRQLGDWLRVNGEAIYGTKPWKTQEDKATPNVWYTSKHIEGILVVYAIALDWPAGGIIQLHAPLISKQTRVYMLGYETPLSWKPVEPQGLTIDVSTISFDKLPCQWAWTLKIEYIK